MEYPMATLITGKRKFGSLVGVTVHEVMHSWYQMVLGTNESLYPWMDEGFTSYASADVMKHLFQHDQNQHAGSYDGYFALVKSGKQEPMSTHADHYETNFAYGISSYSKGAIFLHQLSYIIGQEQLDRTLRRYYDEWQFKHPNPYDFIRVAEKESGLVLDWYLEHWMNTTNTIDYAIGSVEKGSGKQTKVILKRNGVMMMPQEVLVTYKSGEQELFYAPLRVMRGEKPNESDIERTVLQDWAWTHPEYPFIIPAKAKKIDQIEIDPSGRVADTNRDNNLWKTKKD